MRALTHNPYMLACLVLVVMALVMGALLAAQVVTVPQLLRAAGSMAPALLRRGVLAP